jgi:hypothetical protein
MAMFSHGPPFIVKPNEKGPPIKASIYSGDFTVVLESMNGNATECNWNLAEDCKTVFDTRCGREYLIGYDPEEDLRDAIAVRDELKDGCTDAAYQILYKKIFSLEVWSKNNPDIKPLPDVVDSNGKKLFPGSLINFDKIAPRYFDKSMLSFWCQCRQIKSPPSLGELKSLWKVVFERMGEVLEPIPIELMRGSSGYCSPEILIVKDTLETTLYFDQGEALQIIKEVMPDIDDKFFDC